MVLEVFWNAINKNVIIPILSSLWPVLIVFLPLLLRSWPFWSIMQIKLCRDFVQEREPVPNWALEIFFTLENYVVGWGVLGVKVLWLMLWACNMPLNHMVL